MGERAVSVGGAVTQSVIVTGNGNHTKLQFGAVFQMPLQRRQVPRVPRPGAKPRELDLLLPDAAAWPLEGRSDLLDELHAWLDGPADISVHGIIAEAGTGKTRLGVELCGRVDPSGAADSAWVTGFLSPRALVEVERELLGHAYTWQRNTLLVLDYAAEGQATLARWLDHLAGSAPGAKLRILLLDRQAPEGFGWWRELTDPPMGGEAARRDLFHAPRPRALLNLAALEERRRLLRAACQGAARGRGVVAPVVPEPGDAPGFDAKLRGDQFGNPLALAMAGLLALDLGVEGALGLRRLDAARQLGRREIERMRWLGAAAGIDAEAMRHIMGFHGLCGGLPTTGLWQVVRDELAQAGKAAVADTLTSLLEQEYPPRPGRPAHLATILPDLVGEAAVVEAFSGEAWRGEAGGRSLRRAYALTPETTAEALFRVLQDFAYAAGVKGAAATADETRIGAVLMRWLQDLADGVDDPTLLEPLVFALPHETIILRTQAEALTGRLDAFFRSLADGDQAGETTARAALWAANHAYRLSNLGRREDALAAAEEAVRLYRTLAAARPDAFTPDLASSLNNLANMLSELGRREDALAAAEEAVRLYRRLAAARPDAFTPDLASSLNNLANRLSNLGRREDALAAAEEAVRLYRTLAAAWPDAFTPNLARSLNTLANRLSELGRREDAFAAAEEAVRLRRTLAAARPDAFTPDLAMSLNNLANRLSDLGRREDALAAAEEAVQLYRRLAAARPDAFTPDLATSLWVLADLIAEAGDVPAAIALLHEGLEQLVPVFLRFREALGPLSVGLARSYLEKCEQNGNEPDEELLSPIADWLQTQQSPEDQP